ncbi:MAG: hypothetical protein V4490_07055, partial [Pseudomonadota bacterium]
IQALVNSKATTVFAEDAWNQKTNAKEKWTAKELSLLARIGCHIPVTIYDDGAWDRNASGGHLANTTHVHPTPFQGHLLFISGPLLKRLDYRANRPLVGPDTEQNSPPDRCAVIKEVNGHRVIHQELYNQMIEARLLPMLQRANALSNPNNKAIVSLPGIGCGVFSGEFARETKDSLCIAVSAMLEKHIARLPNIRAVVLDTYDSMPTLDAGFSAPKPSGDRVKTIGHLAYAVCATRGRGRCQLSSPEKFAQDLGLGTDNFTLFGGVAGDPVALPTNDYLQGNTRNTVDGSVGASTSACSSLTGIAGQYVGRQYSYTEIMPGVGSWDYDPNAPTTALSHQYFPPDGYNDWEAVYQRNNCSLHATPNNIFITRENGAILTLSAAETAAATTSRVVSVAQVAPVMPVQPVVPRPIAPAAGAQHAHVGGSGVLPVADDANRTALRAAAEARQAEQRAAIPGAVHPTVEKLMQSLPRKDQPAPNPQPGSGMAQSDAPLSVTADRPASDQSEKRSGVFAYIISRLAFPFVWIGYLLSTDPQGRTAYERAVDWMHRFVSGNSNEVAGTNTQSVPPKGMPVEPASITPSAAIPSLKADMSAPAAGNNSSPTPAGRPVP